MRVEATGSPAAIPRSKRPRQAQRGNAGIAGTAPANTRGAHTAEDNCGRCAVRGAHNQALCEQSRCGIRGYSGTEAWSTHGGDLAAIAREATARYQPQAAEHGVTLTSDGAPPARAQADPDRLLQVLSNLRACPRRPLR